MVRLITFGGLAVERGGAEAPLARVKRNALLVYLAVDPAAGSHSRDTVQAIFWPDSDGPHARNALSQLLRSLRTDLGLEALPRGRGNRLVLDPEVVRADAVELREASDAGDHATVVRIYRGPFLEGFHLPESAGFEEWAATQRRRLCDLAVRSAIRRAEDCRRSGEARDAIGILRRALDWSPYQEATLRALLAALLDAGEGGRALLEFERFAERMKRELDVEPAVETVALARRARTPSRGGLPASPTAGSGSAAAGDGDGDDPPGVTLDAPGTTRGRAVAPPASAGRPPLGRPSPAPRRPGRLGAGLVAAVLAAFGLWTVANPSPPPRLAVMPFETLGPAENDYVAAALEEEVLARLGRVDGLQVVSGASPGGDPTPADPVERGRSLEADFVLLGTVYWESDQGDGVRIVARVVRSDDRVEVWSGVHETARADLFAVQARLTAEVARAVGVEVAGGPAAGPVGTDDLEAWTFHQRGRSLMRREWTERTLVAAAAMFDRAVERDPGFVEAWADLSLANSELHHGGWDPSRTRRLRAVQAADRADALEPDHPQVLFARAMIHYRIDGVYEPALRALDRALGMRPADSELLLARAFVLRRMGEWEASLETHRRSLASAPLAARGRGGLVWTLIYLRRYDAALAAIDEAIALFPDMPGFYGTAAYVHLLGWGDVAAARRRLGEARQRLGLSPGLEPRFLVEFLARDFDRARSLAGGGVGGQLDRAVALEHLGEPLRAGAAFDSARAVLQLRVEEDPGDVRSRSYLALALAGLGETDAAVREALAAVQAVALASDAIELSRQRERLVRVYVRAGRYDEALALLDDLLAAPGPVSVELIALDPRYDVLREHPEFDALLRRYGS